MAGEVLFKNGPHASRTGYRGEITEADMQTLRAAAPSYVSDEALFGMANKIMFAGADAKRGDAYVATRHQLAQAKSLLRLATGDEGGAIIDAEGREHRFVALAYALANLDQGTLELIQAAERGAIRAVVDHAGVFVDVDGDEHRFLPPTIQITRPFKRPGVQSYASVWFPRGVEGFIGSVEEVIAGLEMLQDDAGRREKSWQDKLAQAVCVFWQTHCRGERKAANRNSKTGTASPIVEFAKVVFGVAGFRPILSESALANLLHAHRAVGGEPEELDWRDFANRK